MKIFTDVNTQFREICDPNTVTFCLDLRTWNDPSKKDKLDQEQARQLNAIWHSWRRIDVLEHAQYVQVHAGPLDPRLGPDAGGRIGRLRSVLRYLPKLPHLRQIDFINDAMPGGDAVLKYVAMAASMDDSFSAFSSHSTTLAWELVLSRAAFHIWQNATEGGDTLLRSVMMEILALPQSFLSDKIWADVLETQDFCNLRLPCICCSDLPCIRWGVESLDVPGAVDKWASVEIDWKSSYDRPSRKVRDMM